MVITYQQIVEDVLNKGTFKGQLLTFTNQSYEGTLEFKKDSIIESFINIDIEKKLKYIKKTYYNGKITKNNPCIEKIEGNTVYFRSSRLFPTLYLDLMVLNELFPNKKLKLVFKKIFIGYHILGVRYFIDIHSEEANKAIRHWGDRFLNDNLKMLMLVKYKKFLGERNGKRH